MDTLILWGSDIQWSEPFICFKTLFFVKNEVPSVEGRLYRNRIF